MASILTNRELSEELAPILQEYALDYGHCQALREAIKRLGGA